MTLPLDMHAHIEPDIAPSKLVALQACVVAVTRTVADYEEARSRSDPSVVWGVGCHPGLSREVKNFAAERLKEAITTTPIIGEIGLDGTARTPMDAQLATLRSVLAIATETPRLLSLHSYKATHLLVRELQEFRPEAPVLHWWLGTPGETERAVADGAYFSVNASQARRWPSLHLVPLNRILLETDHPFGDRAERNGQRPGNVVKAEEAVAAAVGVSARELRAHGWRNLRSLADRLSLVDLFPREFQVEFLAT